MKKAVSVATLWQWKALEYLAYLTAILIPLMVPKGHLFAYTSPKSFLMLGSVMIMLILYVWAKYREVRQGRGMIRLTWLHGAIAMFVIAISVSAALGVDPHTSWFGTLQQGTGLVYIYAFILWSILIGVLIRRSSPFLISFIAALFTGGVIAALFILFENSTIGNSSFEGAYLFFIACFGIALFLYHQKLWQRVIVGLALVPVLFSSVFFNHVVVKGEISFSSIISNPLLLVGEANGAVLALGVAIVIMIGLFITRSGQHYKRVLGIVLFGVTLFAIVIAGYQLMIPGTALNTSFVEQKSASRFVYWDIAAAGFLDRPLTGWGWGNYGAVYQQYFDPVLFAPRYALEPALQDPHNAIWSYASTTGVFGLVAYVVLLGTGFVVLYRLSMAEDRKVRVVSIVLAASLVGYFLQNMFVFDTPVSYLMLFSVIGIAMGLSPARWNIVLNKRYAGLYGAGVAIIGLASVGSIVLFTIQPWRENKAWFDRVTKSEASEIRPQDISLVGNANDVSYVASNFYASLKNKRLSDRAASAFEAKLALLVSDLEYENNLRDNNYKTYLVKGILQNKLISLSGKADPLLLSVARMDLERSLVLNPRTPEVYFNLAQTAVYERNMSQAYSYIRAGIALQPQYEDGYTIGESLSKVSLNKEFAEYVINVKNK